MVPILQTHDLAARALQLSLQLRDLRRSRGIHLAALDDALVDNHGLLLRREFAAVGERTTQLFLLLDEHLARERLLLLLVRLLLLRELRLLLRREHRSSRGDVVLVLAVLLLLRAVVRRGSRRARRDRAGDGHGHVDTPHVRAFQGLREPFLQMPVRFFQLVHRPGVDVLHRALRRELLVVVLDLERRFLAEPEGVRELLQHRELPGGQTQFCGVFALPLRAVPQLVPQAPAVFLKFHDFMFQLLVQRA